MSPPYNPNAPVIQAPASPPYNPNAPVIQAPASPPYNPNDPKEEDAPDILSVIPNADKTDVEEISKIITEAKNIKPISNKIKEEQELSLLKYEEPENEDNTKTQEGGEKKTISIDTTKLN